MKKYLILLCIFISIFLSGCSNNKVNNTTEDKNSYDIVKHKVITASEANSIYSNRKFENVSEAIEYINKRIIADAENGFKDIYYYGYFSEDDLEFLKQYYESAGYKVVVEYKTLNNDSRIEIAW